METSFWLAKVSSLKFGSAGTVILSGEDNSGVPIAIVINVTDITNIAPRLMHAATVSMYGFPPKGTEISEGLIQVTDGHAFPAKDTQEPGLTLHTHGGLLQFHFPSGVAKSCGKALHEYGIAASAPEPDKMN